MWKMSRKIWLVLTLAVILSAAGCGSGKKESTGTTTPAAGVTVSQTTGAAYIGSFACFRCHNDANNLGGLVKPFGDTQAVSATNPGWLNSRHANTNASPLFTTSEWTTAACATCHDTGADTTTASSFIFDAGLAFYTASTLRPMAGCESCHGAGGNHYGVGPVEHKKPDAAVCSTCHNSSTAHPTVANRTAPTYNAEYKGIYADYAASAHANSLATATLATGSATTVQALCSRCHADEGAKYYLPLWSGAEVGKSSYTELTTAMTGKPDVPNATAVQCRTCHDGHNPAVMLATRDAGTTVAANITGGAWSVQFATCNACHQLLKADGTKNAAAYHDPAVNADTVAAPADNSRIITDTHIATAGYWGAAGSSANTTAPITGYSIDPSSARACANCHNPHAANVTINRQWHASRHGGGSPSDPWSHYDWSQASRAACQRCHSTTGFKGFIAAYIAAGGATPVTALTATQLSNLYNTGNTAGGTAFITPAPPINTWKPEMLQCQGCHSDNKGTLRDPGPFVSPYYMDDTSPENWNGTLADQVTFPDVKGSNLCLFCHTGRESGGSIMNRTATWTSGTSFTNSHYLTAGGVVFKTIGFQFLASSYYDNPSLYQHDKIGLAATNNIGGTNGPCVGCHMTSTTDTAANYGSHRFLPVTKDSNGVITAISTSVCANCHAGQDLITAAKLETQAEELASALTVVEELMFNKGYCFNKASNPYWFTPGASFPTCTSTSKTGWVNNPTGVAATDALIGKQTMGAAFNINLIAHDPGAYAHNRYYVKRLLYDSIDWMDDFTINQSTPGYLNGLTASTTVTNAIAYLIDSSSASYPLSGTGTAQTGGRP